jgi:hypothetical protein
MHPTLLWSNRQRTVRLDLPKIRRTVEVAYPLCDFLPLLTQEWSPSRLRS